MKTTPRLSKIDHRYLRRIVDLRQQNAELLAILREFVAHYKGNAQGIGNGFAYQWCDKVLTLLARCKATP